MPQRKDVDNFFGSFSEADYKHGVALRERSVKGDTQDLFEYLAEYRLSKKVGLAVDSRDGLWTPAQATHGWDKVLGVQYQSKLIADDRTGASIRLDLNMMTPTLIACLHSVHLGQFEKLGYTYVADKAGWFVGAMLRDLLKAYSGKGKKSLRDEIRRRPSTLPRECLFYKNMVRPMPDAEKSLDARLLKSPFDWFHVAWDGDVLFATIFYLKANNECHAAMVYTSFDERSAAFVCSEQPLAFEVSLGHFLGNSVEVGTRRTPVVWPCGDSSSDTHPYPISRAAAEVRKRMLDQPRAWT